MSKRIAALERYYGRPLIERHGRRVVLTHQGTRLVEKVAPLVSELRSVFLEDHVQRGGQDHSGRLRSHFGQLGPGSVRRGVRRELSEVEFSFHAQRSPVVLDRLRTGEYMVGICTGYSDAETDLQSEVIRLEPMVIIPAGLEPLDYRPGEPLEVLTIESRSGAWASIEDDMRRLRLHRKESLESFFSVAQMALAGFGHGLVPIWRGPDPGCTRRPVDPPRPSRPQPPGALRGAQVHVLPATGAALLPGGLRRGQPARLTSQGWGYPTHRASASTQSGEVFKQGMSVRLSPPACSKMSRP